MKLKQYLDEKDHAEISALRDICTAHDGTSLKLELDYKLAAATAAAAAAEASASDRIRISEFIYYSDDGRVVGYLGINAFGSGEPELNGMVHPDYRRQGIFTKIFDVAMGFLPYQGDSGLILLLCDAASASGQAFIKKIGARYRNSEYEMLLDAGAEAAVPAADGAGAFAGERGLTLRKATNADAPEIARQNAVYFGVERPAEQEMLLPEEEEKRGMTIWLAEAGGTVVGKVHLQHETGRGAIYGLGVMPEFRGRGYGRAIVQNAVAAFKAEGMPQIMLQVESGNTAALNLYLSCGFQIASTMDYYEYEVARNEDA